MAITLEQQIQCVAREIGMRERVYPNLLRLGKLTRDKADYEIETMCAVLWTLQSLQEPKPEQTNLFNTEREAA